MIVVGGAKVGAHDAVHLADHIFVALHRFRAEYFTERFHTFRVMVPDVSQYHAGHTGRSHVSARHALNNGAVEIRHVMVRRMAGEHSDAQQIPRRTASFCCRLRICWPVVARKQDLLLRLMLSLKICDGVTAWLSPLFYVIFNKYSYFAQHFLYFLPLPQKQGSFLPGIVARFPTVTALYVPCKKVIGFVGVLEKLFVPLGHIVERTVIECRLVTEFDATALAESQPWAHLALIDRDRPLSGKLDAFGAVDEIVYIILEDIPKLPLFGDEKITGENITVVFRDKIFSAVILIHTALGDTAGTVL